MAPTSSIIIAALAAAVVGLASLVTWALYGWRREARERLVTTAQLRAANADIAAANDAIAIVQNRAATLARGWNFANLRIRELNTQIQEAAPFADKGRKLVARRKAQDAARKLGRAK